jgi:hypothetical protein
MAPVEEFVNTMQEASEAEERRRRADEIRERMTRPGTPNALFVRWVMNWGCFCFAVVAFLLTPLLFVVGGAPGGVPPRAPVAAPAAEQPPRRLPRAPWAPRVTLVGLVGGLLAGAGLLVLLQQFAVVYPTMSWAISLLVIGAVLYGLVVPTLGYTIGWMRLNGKVAKIERELGW